jgi:hypothetical protein
MNNQNTSEKLNVLLPRLNDIYKFPTNWGEIEAEIQNSKSKKRYYFLSAAALIFVLTAVFVFQAQKPKPIDALSERLLEQDQILELAKAEQNYLTVIENLEREVLSKSEKKVSSLVSLYKSKLTLINKQINDCRIELRKNPGNTHIHSYLFAALKDKKETLLELKRSL